MGVGSSECEEWIAFYKSRATSLIPCSFLEEDLTIAQEQEICPMNQRHDSLTWNSCFVDRKCFHENFTSYLFWRFIPKIGRANAPSEGLGRRNGSRASKNPVITQLVRRLGAAWLVINKTWKGREMIRMDVLYQLRRKRKRVFETFSKIFAVFFKRSVQQIRNSEKQKAVQSILEDSFETNSSESWSTMLMWDIIQQGCWRYIRKNFADGCGSSPSWNFSETYSYKNCYIKYDPLILDD